MKGMKTAVLVILTLVFMTWNPAALRAKSKIVKITLKSEALLSARHPVGVVV